MRDRRTLMEAVRNPNIFFYWPKPKQWTKELWKPKPVRGFEVEAQAGDQKFIKTIDENDEDYQGFLRWNCDAKKRLQMYADCKDPVKCLNSGKYLPLLLFKLFKNMHIRRCFNHNITKNAQICEQTTDVIFSVLTKKERKVGQDPDFKEDLVLREKRLSERLKEEI